MDSVLIRVTPLTEEERAALVKASGGPKYSLDQTRYFWARDAKGWLVAVRPQDVVQVESARA